MTDAYSVLKHRSEFDLMSLKEDGDPFVTAAGLVVDWFVQKEQAYDGSPIVEDFDGRRVFPQAWDYAMPEDYCGGDFSADNWPALACASVRDDAGKVTRWVMEYDEPDARHDDRRWHTVVCLDRTSDEVCHVGVQSVCRPLGNCSEELPPTVAAPALVRAIVDLPWYVARAGSTQIQTVPNKLSPQTFEHFKDALVDPERKIPLVLFCTGYDGKMPEAAKQLARRALGTANVYVVDWSNDELRELVQNLFKRGTAAGEYACPKGSCRMYMPGIDLENHNASMSHESWNREALTAIHPSQFAERLARRFLPSRPVTTIAAMNEAPEGPSAQE